jgi:hypothetical protein
MCSARLADDGAVETDSLTHHTKTSIALRSNSSCGEWRTWCLIHVRVQLLGFLSKSCLDLLRIRLCVNLKYIIVVYRTQSLPLILPPSTWCWDPRTCLDKGFVIYSVHSRTKQQRATRRTNKSTRVNGSAHTAVTPCTLWCQSNSQPLPRPNPQPQQTLPCNVCKQQHHGAGQHICRYFIIHNPTRTASLAGNCCSAAAAQPWQVMLAARSACCAVLTMALLAQCAPALL